MPIHQKHFDWGFLYHKTPHSLTEIPSFDKIHQLALQMPKLIKQTQFRERVTELPILNTPDIHHNDLPTVKLALAMLAQGFVWCEGEENKAEYLPESIARPLVEISKQLDEPPILNYADYVLRNSQLSKPEIKGLSQFKSLYTFTGMKSEHGFILTHIWYELKGREAFQMAFHLSDAIEKLDIEATKKHLEKLNVVILELIEKFNTVHHTTSEIDFRDHFRIYLKGWKENIPAMTYQGINIKGSEFRGETGAQSSLLPFLDTLIGISPQLIQYNPLYAAWRAYMPKDDRDLLSKLETLGQKIRDIVQKHPILVQAYNPLLDGLIAFRKNHLLTITKYIEGKEGYSAKGLGTGGTFYGTYLSGVIDQIESLKL